MKNTYTDSPSRVGKTAGGAIRNTHFFERHLFIKFFIPALLSSLGLAITEIANNFYVGNTMSDSGLFILGAAQPIYMVFNTISYGIAMGGSIRFSSLLGEGKKEEGNSVFFSVLLMDFFVITTLCVLGLIFIDPLVALLGCTKDMAPYGEMVAYVRLMLISSPISFLQAPLHYFVYSDNSPKLASAAFVVGNSCDCVFGFLFIVVLKMGVKGSIASTVCAALAMEAVCLYHLIWGKGTLKLRNIVLPKVGTAVRSFYTGFASSIQYLYQFVVILAFNRVLLKMGGEPMVAIYNTTSNAGVFATAVTEALILAMIPIVAIFFREKNIKSMRQCVRLSLTVGTLMTAGISLLLILFSGGFYRLMGLSESSIADAAYAMRMYMLSSIIASINSVISAYLQNIGKEKLSYIIMGLRGIVVLLPCGFLLATGGYHMFWSTFLITEGLVLLGITVTILIMNATKHHLLEDLVRCRVFTETFSGTCGQISDTCERIQKFLEENGAGQRKAYLVSLAVDETCRLIAENGGILLLQLTLVIKDGEYILYIRDNANQEFSPMEMSEDSEATIGLKIVRKQAKGFNFQRFVGYNTLTVVFGGE